MQKIVENEKMKITQNLLENFLVDVKLLKIIVEDLTRKCLILKTENSEKN